MGGSLVQLTPIMMSVTSARPKSIDKFEKTSWNTKKPFSLDFFVVQKLFYGDLNVLAFGKLDFSLAVSVTKNVLTKVDFHDTIKDNYT